MLMVLVCLTSALSIAWSNQKLMSQDEMYEFQTDSVGSVAELIRVQETWPISLDPLVYHVLSHGAMQVFGVGSFAQRFPALLGFLLMQVCLFFFVRNLAGERAGVVAAAFPALTATLYYSAEGRPYGLLLGLYALALLSWQRATRKRTGRAWALVGLAAALAATINSHYFGVLLLFPVCAAEVWRTMLRRRIDWPVVTAIVIGTAGLLATRPFLKAAGEFRKNYYNSGSVGLHDITRAYRSIFVDYTKMAIRAQHLWMLVLCLLGVSLLWGCWRVIRGREVLIPAAEWVLLIALAVLPFCGYVLARLVTHSIEVRYVVGALVAISAMAGVATSQWLRRDKVFSAVLVALVLGIVGLGALSIREEQRNTAERLASLVVPADVKAALDENPDGRLYIQNMGAFEEDRYYEPDPDIKSRMTLVYSADEELRWNRHDTMALTAMHMEHFTPLPIISFEKLRNEKGPHFFVLFHTGWDWTDEALAYRGASTKAVGKTMGGDAAVTRFQSPQP